MECGKAIPEVSHNFYFLHAKNPFVSKGDLETGIGKQHLGYQHI